LNLKSDPEPDPDVKKKFRIHSTAPPPPQQPYMTFLVKNVYIAGKEVQDSVGQKNSQKISPVRRLQCDVCNRKVLFVFVFILKLTVS
jgi:hypothetical protein